MGMFLTFGGIGIVAALLCWSIASYLRRRWQSLPSWASVISLALLAGLVSYLIAWPVGESLVVVHGGTSPEDEAEAGPLVFAALMLFAFGSSLAATVGGGIGAFLAYRGPLAK